MTPALILALSLSTAGPAGEVVELRAAAEARTYELGLSTGEARKQDGDRYRSTSADAALLLPFGGWAVGPMVSVTETDIGRRVRDTRAGLLARYWGDGWEARFSASVEIDTTDTTPEAPRCLTATYRRWLDRRLAVSVGAGHCAGSGFNATSLAGGVAWRVR